MVKEVEGQSVDNEEIAERVGSGQGLTPDLAVEFALVVDMKNPARWPGCGIILWLLAAISSRVVRLAISQIRIAMFNLTQFVPGSSKSM